MLHAALSGEIVGCTSPRGGRWVRRAGIELGNQGDDRGVDGGEIAQQPCRLRPGQRGIIPDGALQQMRAAPDDHQRIAKGVTEVREGGGTSVRGVWCWG